MRLSLRGASSYLGLGFDAKGETEGLGAALRIDSFKSEGTMLLAGNGSASGYLRILVDPTSPTSLSRTSLVELDTSLQSRSSVVGIIAGPVSIFGFGKGKGLARELEAGAAGIAYGFYGQEGGISAIAAASLNGAVPTADGWLPDPSSSPAANAIDPFEPCLNAALLAERRNELGASIFAIAASYGRLAGPGFAFRLETRETAGPVSLRLASGVAAPTFRTLAGPRQARLLDASAEARVAMRRASSLSASIEAQADGASLLYAPLWGTKESLRLTLPSGESSGAYLETRIDAESPTDGKKIGSWSLDLVQPNEAECMSSDEKIGCSLSWDSGLAGLELTLKTRLAGRGGLPTLELDLSLDLFDKGNLDSPVVAMGGARVRLPFGKGASLELEASIPEKGIVLAPSDEKSNASPIVLCLRYRASLSAPSPAKRRPRSRNSTLPKASSIAQRAAS